MLRHGYQVKLERMYAAGQVPKDPYLRVHVDHEKGCRFAWGGVCICQDPKITFSGKFGSGLGCPECGGSLGAQRSEVLTPVGDANRLAVIVGLELEKCTTCGGPKIPAGG